MSTKPKSVGRPPHPEMHRAVEMVREGSTLTAAAAEIGVSITAVRLACHNAKLKPAKRGRPRGRAPLGPEWKCVRWKWSNARIARKVGLTPERVRQVRKDLGFRT